MNYTTLEHSYEEVASILKCYCSSNLNSFL